jgi:hypothetical protein
MARRYKDRKKVGHSAIVPFIADESAAERHKRRLKTNCEQFEIQAKAWCLARNISLNISNNGHHWKFANWNSEQSAEWWPSSAKFVFQKKYRNGIHVHDWLQARELIAEKWNCCDEIEEPRGV